MTDPDPADPGLPGGRQRFQDGGGEKSAEFSSDEKKTRKRTKTARKIRCFCFIKASPEVALTLGGGRRKKAERQREARERKGGDMRRETEETEGKKSSPASRLHPLHQHPGKLTSILIFPHALCGVFFQNARVHGVLVTRAFLVLAQ